MAETTGNPEWLYEFLYRGNPSDAGAWHLIIMDQMGRQTVFNMAQATERGFALPKILDNINANSLIDIENMKKQMIALTSQNNALQQENQELRAAVERLQGLSREPEAASTPPPAGEGNAEQIEEAGTPNGGGSPQS